MTVISRSDCSIDSAYAIPEPMSNVNWLSIEEPLNFHSWVTNGNQTTLQVAWLTLFHNAILQVSPENRKKK